MSAQTEGASNAAAGNNERFTDIASIPPSNKPPSKKSGSNKSSLKHLSITSMLRHANDDDMRQAS